MRAALRFRRWCGALFRRCVEGIPQRASCGTVPRNDQVANFVLEAAPLVLCCRLTVAAFHRQAPEMRRAPRRTPYSPKPKSRELLTRAHLRGDPRHGRVASADKPRRSANARSRGQRSPYSRFALCRQLGRPKAFPLLVPFARALAMPPGPAPNSAPAGCEPWSHTTGRREPSGCRAS
jgi:hypothetical protein